MADSFFIKTVNSKFVRIYYHEVLYIESLQNYSRLITKTQKTIVVIVPISHWVKQLPSHLFFRIHKSFIINLQEIISFDYKTVQLCGKDLPLSHKQKSSFFEKVNVIERLQETAKVIVEVDDFCVMEKN